MGEEKRKRKTSTKKLIIAIGILCGIFVASTAYYMLMTNSQIAQLNNVNAQVISLNSTISNLNAQLNTSNAEVTRLNSVITEKNNTITNLNTTISNLNLQTVILNSQINNLTSKVYDQQSTISNQSSQILNWESSYNSLQADYNNYTASHTHNDSDFNSLQTDVTNLQTKFANLQTSYTSLQTNYTSLQGYFSDPPANLTNLQTAYVNLNNDYYLLANYINPQNVTFGASNAVFNASEIQTFATIINRLTVYNPSPDFNGTRTLQWVSMRNSSSSDFYQKSMDFLLFWPGRGADGEWQAVLSIYNVPDSPSDYVVEVSRFTWWEIQVKLDGNTIADFPQVTSDSTSFGYATFHVVV
jgi:predicted  nucleic acid-binding Zn-ribbon protein